MNAYWSIKGRGDKLLVVFNGWGCDAQILDGIDLPGFDLVILSDYASLDCPELDDLPGYGETRLLAWSFGVFAAGACLPRLRGISRRIAVNGTPWPVDDERGIPRRVFEMTLKRYHSEANRLQFCRRVIGEGSGDIPQGLLGRTLQSQQAELHALARMATPGTPEQLAQEAAFPQWDAAVISLSDNIFPPGNMKRAWGDRAHEIPGHHLPGFQHLINHFILP